MADPKDPKNPHVVLEEVEQHTIGEVHKKDIDAIYDIPVQISAVLGKSTMQVSQLLKLGRGAVVELDRKVGEAIDIYVNNRLVARGEVIVVEDRLGVTMTEIVKSDRGGQ
ncbi:MAG: flagellar motor switch protein FliN [Alphaproteobacteria bacterium]